jgi:hypothetical protein
MWKWLHLIFYSFVSVLAMVSEFIMLSDGNYSIRVYLCEIITFVFSYCAYREYKSLILKRRIHFIYDYTMPKSIVEKFYLHHPELSEADIQKVIDGLKMYFMCCLQKNTYSYMPSKVIDMLWHEFILNTIEYAKFCNNAFGEFLHHIPSNYKTSENKKQGGLKTIWQYCFQQESIN